MSESAPKLLLLHGFMSSRAAWGRVEALLGEDVQVVRPNLLGYGDAHRPRGSYELDHVLDHLEPLLEREQPTHVVGHSMGAIVTLALAARHPGAFEGAGVLGLPVFRDGIEGREFLRQRGGLYRFVMSSDVAAHAWCVGMYRTRPVWMPIAKRSNPLQPPDALAATFDHSWSSHSGGLNRVVFGCLVEDLACRVRTPIAALHGTRDRSAPIERVRGLARRHGWPLQAVHGASHQVLVEDPPTVVRWLKREVLRTEPITPSAATDPQPLVP